MAEKPYTPPQGMGTRTLPRKASASTFALIFIATIAVLMLAALNMPICRIPEHVSREMTCDSNFRQISLAMGAYHDQYQAFPPAYTVDGNGNPLHSWRTLILPYLNEQTLYDSIDMTKPWDDEVNRPFWNSMPAVYRCPENRDVAQLTTYLAIVSPGSCIQPERSSSFSDVKDGAGSTVMVIDVSETQGVNWMSPQDADLELFLAIGSKYSPSHLSGIKVTCCDGRVMRLDPHVAEKERKAMVSIAGNDTWE